MSGETHERVRLAEVELLSSVVRGDPVRVAELLHPEFVEIGRSGRLWERDEIIASLAAEEPRTTPLAVDWRLSDLTPELVLVTYLLHGESVSSRHSSIWDVSQPTARLRFHQGTIVPLA